MLSCDSRYSKLPLVLVIVRSPEVMAPYTQNYTLVHKAKNIVHGDLTGVCLIQTQIRLNNKSLAE